MVSADTVRTVVLRPVSEMHRETIVNERRGSRVAKRGNNEGSIYQGTDGRGAAARTLPGGKRRTLYGKTRIEVSSKLAATKLSAFAIAPTTWFPGFRLVLFFLV